MDTNQEAYSQIGLAMAKHFDSVYYVDIEPGHPLLYKSIVLERGEESP